MTAVFLENGAVRVGRRVAKPRPRRGYALIRLRLAGICNTDLELARGYGDFHGRPGHEFVGDVVESEDPAWTGRRVVGEINLACGHCEWCVRGLGRHCPRRTVLGIVRHPGAFAEFFTLPVGNLHGVPDSVPDEDAVFTEPVAAACEVLDQVALPRGAEVAVLGDGKLGLLVAQVLQGQGSRVRLFGRHPENLRLAEAAGVSTANAGSAPAAAFDWVVEATGSPDGLRHAVAMARPLGTVVLKSTVHGLVPADTAPVVVNELTLIGSRCGRFEPALRLIESGRLRFDGMIQGRFPLARAPEAFERAARKGALKILLEPA